ncbi:MAG: hypothetical protein HKO65_11455 [Gemmatimonadetes bacterium]|nr:hypothetical protein [Gemmatimonadota bacterium]NNM05693.1 hypothetical protein [Gemmatimonadota bacterium]
MKTKRAVGIVALPLLGAAVLWGIANAKSAPVRWGSDGHRMAAQAAHGILPESMPAFFREAKGQLEYLSPEPDRWRIEDFTEMDEAWRYDHYIDLENVPPGALDASDRFEFIEALYDAGIERPQQNVGFLPFRILEMQQRLTSGFARWRLTSAGTERDWIESRVLNDAGIIGHYVVDAAQPHHTTIHFNGWADDAPNPRGFTTDRGFHSRFESGFVRAHINPRDLTPGLPRSPSRLGNVRKAIWEHVEASNATVERLYRLEKEFGFEPDGRAHAETKEFVTERLTAGAEMLAAVWWTSWLDSERVAEAMREERRGR